ncbi:MAG: HAMP domain-containing protein [Acidobacteriota bacterium]|nr:HAMP domain-containing protein [Acidobacteriota bacterium]
MRAPIRVRLAGAYCAAFLVTAALLETGAYFTVKAAVNSIVDRELYTRLAAVDDHVSRHIHLLGWPKLSEALGVHPGFEPSFLSIRRPSGESLFAGQALAKLNGASYQAAPRIVTVDLGEHTLRLLTVRRGIHGSDYDMALAADLLVPSAILRKLWFLMLLSSPLVLLIASAAGYWMGGRALAPVSNIIASARSVDSRNLNARIDVPATGDEIQQLARTIRACGCCGSLRPMLLTNCARCSPSYARPPKLPRCARRPARRTAKTR